MNSKLCFCGSNKSREDCHYNIYEDSRAAKVLKLYNKIDSAIEKHYEGCDTHSKCRKGCAECCYTDFPFSDIEMDLIMYEVFKWDPEKVESFMERAAHQWNNIYKKYPDYIKTLATNGTKNKKIVVEGLSYNPDQKDFRCPFLDEKNSCMIYAVRPVICRTHGTAFTFSEIEDEDCSNFNICSHIPDSKLQRRIWQADLNSLNSEIDALHNIHVIPYSYKLEIRTYPMFYYIYNRFLSHNKPIPPIDLEIKFRKPESVCIQHMYSKT